MKSILVIDTPKECDGCPCLNQKLWECQADKKRRSSDERPSCCPLKPMPEKKVVLQEINKTFSSSDESEYNKGWNDCLDAITGETE